MLELVILHSADMVSKQGEKTDQWAFQLEQHSKDDYGN